MSGRDYADTEQRLIIQVEWEVTLDEAPDALRALNQAKLVGGTMRLTTDVVTRAVRESLNERAGRLIEHEEDPKAGLEEQMETFRGRLPFAAPAPRDGFETK